MKNATLLLDIGTTTIKALLLDKANRRGVASDFILNGQLAFGEDVISRIAFSIKGPDNKKILKEAVLGSINALIKNISKNAAFKPLHINEAVVVCNTAMHHLFLGLDAESLIKPPYKALQKSEIIIKAKELGIAIYPEADVVILPNIGGFVGSDAIGFIIASGIYKSDSVQLAVDIGTNGEVILGSRAKILVTSTAAGPAFEGRYISCGMPAIKGAIEKVAIAKNGSTKLSVIGNTSPKGICGSGLIDAAAQMLKRGIMDKTGRMNPALSSKGTDLRKSGMKEDMFILYKKGTIKISVTQEDIRKMQLAKAAIYAGIKVLMRQLGIETGDINKIFISGSFGNSINPESALLTALIPAVSPSRVKFIKDAPLEGAKRFILSKKIQTELVSILSRVKRIPLIRRDFQERFAESMRF